MPDQTAARLSDAQIAERHHAADVRWHHASRRRLGAYAAVGAAVGAAMGGALAGPGANALAAHVRSQRLAALEQKFAARSTRGMAAHQLHRALARVEDLRAKRTAEIQRPFKVPGFQQAVDVALEARRAAAILAAKEGKRRPPPLDDSGFPTAADLRPTEPGPVGLRIRQLRRALSSKPQDTIPAYHTADPPLTLADVLHKLRQNEETFALDPREERYLQQARKELLTKQAATLSELKALEEARPRWTRRRAATVRTRKTAAWKQRIAEKRRAAGDKQPAPRGKKPTETTARGKVGTRTAVRAAKVRMGGTLPAKHMRELREQLVEELNDHVARLIGKARRDPRLRARLARWGPEAEKAYQASLSARYARMVGHRVTPTKMMALLGRQVHPRLLPLARPIAGALEAGARGVYRVIHPSTWRAVAEHRMPLSVAILAGAGALLGLRSARRKPAPERPLHKAARQTADDISAHHEHRIAAGIARGLVAPLDTAAWPDLGAMDAALHKHAAPALRDAVTDGGKTPISVEEETDSDHPRLIAHSFELRSPHPEAYAREHAAKRIVEISRRQRDTVRNVIVEATRRGTSPDEIARKVRETVGLTSLQASYVARYRDELESGKFAKALSRKLRDKRFDRAIERAVRDGNGLSPEQITRMVDAYQRRWVAHRAMTIARTEGVGAANNGHIAALRAFLTANPDLEVVKTWLAKRDDRTRPDHDEMHGQSVAGLDMPFTVPSGGTIRWPHDPDGAADEVINCRCSLVTRLVPKRVLAVRGVRAFGLTPKEGTTP